MKRKDFHVSLYILVPTIFSGISVIAVIVAYRITAYYILRGINPDIPILTLVIAIAVFAFVCGFLTIWFIVKPVIRFVKAAKILPVMSQTTKTENAGRRPENIEDIQIVLDQVTTILGKVEARELFPHIIGQSRVLRSIFGQIMKVAPTDTTVLLSGESGTGKELVATAIYEQSLRRDKPFIKINCVAIPEGLLESELFGHEKGAFTGAVAQKKGKFELADSGTIFLDEIGDMPLTTQAKILRVLQEKEFERVGGTHSINVNVRLIAATNKNLQQMVKTGAFREDLFYRLNVFSLHLPPLRERREDIPLLIEHFLKQSGKELDVSQKAIQLLLAYHWPGNIRELQNVIERAAIIAEETIEPTHLPSIFMSDIIISSNYDGEAGKEKSLDKRLHEMEKIMIIDAMTRAGGVQVRAAELLGINERSLWHRIKKYHIDVSPFKNPQNL